MLKLIGKSLAALLLLWSALATGVSGAELPELRLTAGLDSLLELRSSSLARRDALQKQADELATEVARLKESLAGRFSRLEQYRLEGALRSSQVVADSIDLLNRAVSACTDELAAQSLQATAYYTSVLDSLTLELKDIRNRKLRGEMIEKIERLQAERAALARYSTAARAGKPSEAGFSLSQLVQAVQVLPQDSPEEIHEKADFLTDIAARWSRTLAEVEKNIERLSDERAIKRRLSEFAQEISLFDGTGPSSRAAVKPSPASPDDKVFRTESTESFGDYSTDAFGETSQPGQLTSDLELGELESGMWLLENLDNLSADKLEAAIGLLQTRRDSLQKRLEILHAMEHGIRSKAGETEQLKEDAPPK